MQLIIHTETDRNRLQGKFVLQVNTNTPDDTITSSNWDFIKEKRLYLITELGYVTLYGYSKQFETFEKFKNWFNYYLFDHMLKEGKIAGGRFHRLLTSEELDYLLVKIKEENY